MKIGFVVLGGVDRSGEHRVTPWLLWLLERLAGEHEVHVFALRQELRPSRYELFGARVVNIGARRRRVRALGAILAEHRSEPFDVLHALSAAPMGVIAAAAGRLTRVPVLVHITGGDFVALPEIGYGTRANWRGRAWLKLAMAGASKIVVPSKSTQAAAVRLGIATEHVPFGVALDRWPPREPRPRRAGEPARLLHVADLNRVKDQPTLLRAAQRLTRDGVELHLEIAGEDTLDGEIQSLARELGLAERVTFHGFLPHRKLRPLMESADILIVSSRHETGPLVSLEAAAAGVPTVGTVVGFLPEWAPEAAATVPVGDHEALAAAVGDLLGDEQRRLAMAEAAQQRVVRQDADWMTRRFVELYEEMVQKRR